MGTTRLVIVVDAMVADDRRLSVTLDSIARADRRHHVVSIRIAASRRSSLPGLEYLDRLPTVDAYRALDIQTTKYDAAVDECEARVGVLRGADHDYVLFLRQGDEIDGGFIDKSCLILDADPGVAWVDPHHIDEMRQPFARFHSVGGFVLARRYTSGFVYRLADARRLLPRGAGTGVRFIDLMLQAALLGEGRVGFQTRSIVCRHDSNPVASLQLKPYTAGIVLALRYAGLRMLTMWRGFTAERRHIARGKGYVSKIDPRWLPDEIVRRIFRRMGLGERAVTGNLGLLWTLLVAPRKFEERLADVDASLSAAEIRGGFFRKPRLDVSAAPPSAGPQSGIVFAHTNWTVGGAERVLQTWMRSARLATKGRLVEIVERETWSMTGYDGSFALTDGGVRQSFAELSDDQYSLESLTDSPQARLRLLIEVIKRERPRVLFISGNAYAYAALPAIKAMFPGLIVVDILHNEWRSRFDWFNVAAEYDRLIDGRIVISPHWRRVLIEKYRTAFTKVAVVPNGISLLDFAPDAGARATRRASMGFAESDRVICFIGRLQEQKNPDVFFKLVDQFASVPGYHFVVAGDGPERERLIQKYGNHRNLTYLGSVTDVAGLLQAADLVVYTSTFEGYPLGSLEAAAINVPIVAPDIVGFREQLELGRFGLSYTPSGNADEDAWAIRGIILDRWNDLQEARSNGRPFVQQHHDISLVRSAQVHLLRGYLEGKSRPRRVSRQPPPLTLHIGMPKTGSSSLQWYFHHNRSLLAEQGVLYPDEQTASYAHHPVAWFCKPEGRPPSPDAAKFYENRDKWVTAMSAFLENMRESPYDRLLLSSEVFYGTEVKAIRELLAGFDVQVIVMVRRQDAYLESSYNQNSKILGRPFGEEQFMPRRMKAMDYATKLEPWAKHFGHGNIRLIPFERRNFPRGIEHKFAVDILGLKWNSSFRVDVQNVRMSRDCLEFLYRLNALGRLPRQQYLDSVYLSEDYSAAHPDPPAYANMLSPDRRRDILRKFAESNATVAKTYLGSEEPLFSDEIADVEIWKPYPGLTREAAEGIAAFLASRGVERRALNDVVAQLKA